MFGATSYEKFKSAFSLTCWLLASSMIGFWCYYFFENEDLCLVDYKPFFETEEDVFPAASLCISNPFLETELSKYGPDVNTSSYVEFLSGRTMNSRMMEVNYDNVSIKLTDYLMHYWVLWKKLI